MSDEVLDSSFGRLRITTWAIGDSHGRGYRDPGDKYPSSLIELLSEEFQDCFGDWQHSLSMDAGAIYRYFPSSAHKHIFTSAVNDVASLMSHVDRLDGRSAAHSARSLFEHLVDMADVTSSVTNTGDRYLGHRHVTAKFVSARRWHLQYLDRKHRKQEERRLDKVARNAEAPLSRLIGIYGARYSGGWAEGSLRNRAASHGYEDGYDGYRILSSVIHGSSGALAGVVRELKDGEVHRFGPDLELAATAYAEGLASFFQLMAHVGGLMDRPEAEELRDRTHGLLLGLQEVRSKLQQIDNRVSPRVAPLGVVDVVAIYGSGKRKWYVLDRRDESIRAAIPPDVEPDLSFLNDHVRSHDPKLFGGRAITFPFNTLFLKPVANSPVVPADSIMLPKGHDVYSLIDLRPPSRGNGN